MRDPDKVQTDGKGVVRGLSAGQVYKVVVKRVASELTPVAPIHYDGAGRTYTYDNGDVIPDVSGDVSFVKPLLDARPDAWSTFAAGPHEPNPSQYADVNRHATGYAYLKAPFQVFGPGEAFTPLDGWTRTKYGGVVKCQLATGEVIQFAHFNDISLAVYHAAKEGRALPAGTWLGTCRAKIGLTSGAHIHIDAYTNSTLPAKLERKVWMPLLRQGRKKLPSDSKYT